MGDINWKDKCWVTTIFMVRGDGKVLLTMNKNLGTWIPVGGHIDPGDLPNEAIAREVEEETGFEFEFYNDITKSSGVEIYKPIHIQIEDVPHHNKHINIVWYGKCTKYFDKKTTDEDEELRWFSKEEILELKDEMLETVYTNSLDAIEKIGKSDG